MSWNSWTDGLTPWTSADAMAMQRQTVAQFATVAARTTAIPSPTDGQLTYVTATKSIEQFRDGTWRVVWAEPSKTSVSGTPPTTSDASLSTQFYSVDLKNGLRYRVTAQLRVDVGTMKLTSLGTNVSGYWGNATDGSDAAVFDKTSADAVLNLSAGMNYIVGEIVASADTTWNVFYYNQTGTAQLVSPSFIKIERVTS